MAQFSALAEATTRMFKDIPQVIDVQVSRGTAETAERSWDVMLEVRFANKDDASAYMVIRCIWLHRAGAQARCGVQESLNFQLTLGDAAVSG